MRKILFLALLIALSAVISFAGSGQKSAPLQMSTGSTAVTATYANSQVDTVIVSRDNGLDAITFACHFKDSVSITRAVVRRVYDGQVAAVLAGDTLTNFTTYATTTDAGSSVGQSIPLTPLPDAWWVIVTYAGSNNGFTTNTVKYEFLRKYNKNSN